MSAKQLTRKVDYYIDLWRGWHIGEYKPCVFSSPPSDKSDGTTRIRITVELPVIDQADDDAPATVEVVE